MPGVIEMYSRNFLSGSDYKEMVWDENFTARLKTSRSRLDYYYCLLETLY